MKRLNQQLNQSRQMKRLKLPRLTLPPTWQQSLPKSRLCSQHARLFALIWTLATMPRHLQSLALGCTWRALQQIQDTIFHASLRKNYKELLTEYVYRLYLARPALPIYYFLTRFFFWFVGWVSAASCTTNRTCVCSRPTPPHPTPPHPNN